ncbi:MAG: DUF4389 domain-containing protein, partial [Solirubrobacterales bacterium]
MNDSSPPEPPSQPPPGVEPPPPPPGEGGQTFVAPQPRGAYPTRLTVDYPDRELDKPTTFFRIIWAIPIVAVLAAIGGYFGESHFGAHWHSGAAGGLLFIPVAMMIVFREKYPRWWFDFNVELARFATRVGVYALALTDEYPATDAEQYVHLEIDYPDVQQDLNRFMPIIKWLAAIPHYIVLFFLFIGALVAAIYGWFVVLFTGRYPHDVFDFIVGVMRWHLRVISYAVLLTTDEYPPFSFD